MRAACEDALICDFAQYYHIYDIDSLDIRSAAVLANGLPQESRTAMKRNGTKLTRGTILMASILDTARSIEYGVFQSHSKKKLKRPKSVLKKLLGIDEEKRQAAKGFKDAEAFEAARQQILQGGIKDGR